METRQNFIDKIATGMAGSRLTLAPNRSNVSVNQIKNAFVHHVFFWLREPADAEARQQFELGLQSLIKVPQIQSSHIGIAVESSREVVDDSFTYSYMAFFRNKEDQDIYQTHPIHLKFVEDCQHLWEKVVVYDAMV